MLDIQKTKEEIMKDRLIELDNQITMIMVNLTDSVDRLTKDFLLDDIENLKNYSTIIGSKTKDVFNLLQATRQFISSINPNYNPPELPNIIWSKNNTVETVLE